MHVMSDLAAARAGTMPPRRDGHGDKGAPMSEHVRYK